jgi:phage shock protein A
MLIFLAMIVISLLVYWSLKNWRRVKDSHKKASEVKLVRTAFLDESTRVAVRKGAEYQGSVESLREKALAALKEGDDGRAKELLDQIQKNESTRLGK